MKTVHVVGNQQSYIDMFEDHGWTPVDDIKDADLVQFCGGPDVWPGLYKEQVNPKTKFNLFRDRYEIAMWKLAQENGCAIAGICRGAQFIHVRNKGSLWQHVNNHASGGSHLATIEIPEFTGLAPKGVFVSSTHHQMMREGVGTVVLATRNGGGTGGFATIKEGERGTEVNPVEYKRDIEAVWYERTNSLAYQPHPEYYTKSNACQILYFQLIKRLLTFKEEEDT